MMRVKMTLRRHDGSHDDLVVEADAGATIGEVASSISRVDPRGPRSGTTAGTVTLEARLPGQDRPALLPADAALGEAWIGSGAEVSVVDRARPGFGYGASTDVRATLHFPGGHTVDLTEGTWTLGRAAGADIVLNDPMVSKQHLRLDVGDAVDVVDLGSANGVLVDGDHVHRLRVETSQRVVVGDTEITVESRRRSSVSGVAPKAGPIPFTRSPRVEPRYHGEELEAPEVPTESDPQDFPMLMMVAPVLLGIAMFLVMNNPRMLLFVLFTPLMLIGSHLTQARRERKRRERDVRRFEERLGSLTDALVTEQATERSVRLREAPATQHVFAEAMRHGPLLWTRRPEHWSFLNLRLGVGTMPSRNTVRTGGKGAMLKEYQERLDAVVTEHGVVAGVPVVENLHDAGGIGFAGPPAQVVGSLNAALVQLTGLHSPAELVVAGMVTPAWTQHLGWLTWMPHTSSPHSPLDGHHLADSASGATRLMAELEGLVADRLKERRARDRRRGAVDSDDAALDRGAGVGQTADGGTESPVPAVVVVISDDIDVDRARLVQLAEQGADAGVFPLWISADVASLPASCRTFVDRGDRVPRVGMVRIGLWVDDLEVEEVDPAAALDFARRLAPVYDAGAIVEDAGDLPRSVTVPALLGHDLFEDPDAVLDRWRQNQSLYDRTTAVPRRRAGSLRAVVGSAGVDLQHLDLRSQGPHALVGGTTGAGKSEFLQAWVLGMAAEYSPDRVTFLFVDYKGGSAFADCVSLPHCVGLVTDLSPHLVLRALTSLRAELHHREHLFNRKKVKDLLELEKRGDPETPPALVIVIDEFAALASDVPQFVDGVVDVAQRGRSLGIHLIMATQRPAGVIKDNLRANTNLRVALRMADESDSSDVVDVRDAAHIDPDLPGRGVVKTGPGRVHSFQSAYAGAWSTRDPERAAVVVSGLRFGREEVWEEPAAAGPEAPVEDLGPNDQQRLVARINEAFEKAALRRPRRPWLDSLADVYSLTRLQPRTDTQLILGVVDVPSEQSQRAVSFAPDEDGHLGVYGTGGAGKSTVLRTIAAAAGITPRGGPVHVYAMDFAAGALRMLDGLPHVGSVVRGDSVDGVVSLLRLLRDELGRRAESFAAVAASSVTEYRRLTQRPDVPRILLLIDGFAAFRDDFETGAGRAEWYEVFRDILNDGRGLGMHVVFTADRAGAVPSYMHSMVHRNLLLRLNEDGYLAFNAPKDVITSASPPGRGLLDDLEVQVAVLGGTSAVVEQAAATGQLAASMRAAGVLEAPPVPVLPHEYAPSALPDAVDGLPVLGLEHVGVRPHTFRPTGTVVVAGPPGSGRSNALSAMVGAVRRASPTTRCYLMSAARSELAGALEWDEVAVGAVEVTDLAQRLQGVVQDPEVTTRVVVVIEGLADFQSTTADLQVQMLTKLIRVSEHLLVAEAAVSSWASSWPIFAEIKQARRGLLLQPGPHDSENILATPMPRADKNEFPVGRGIWVERGRLTRVQLPLLAP